MNIFKLRSKLIEIMEKNISKLRSKYIEIMERIYRN